MPNRLHLGPDGRFQSAVPRLTHVHTRAHTLAGPRLTRLDTLAVPRLTRVHTLAHSLGPDLHVCTRARACRALPRLRADPWSAVRLA